MRLYNQRDLDGFVNAFKNIPRHILNSNPKILKIQFEGTSTDGETEIDPVTNKLQVSSAEQLEYVSSSSDDNSSSSGHLQKFKAIVVDEDNEPIVVEFTMDDSDGTTVITTTNKYKDVWHTYGSSYGSGDINSAGNVDLRQTDDTVICRIASGEHEGNGSGFKIPDGWKGCLLKGDLNADGTQASNEGKILKLYINDSEDQETDQEVLNYIQHQVYGYTREQKVDTSTIFQEGTEITFFINRVNDGNEDFTAHIEILLWEV
jgi:hypothetical protein